MTTIVATLDCMAADSRVSAEGAPFYHSDKIFRIGDSLFGTAGDGMMSLLMIDWLRGTRKNRLALYKLWDDYERSNFWILELSPAGLFLWDGWAVPEKLNEARYAIGSGAMSALAALDAGASPEDAVKRAANYDQWLGMTMKFADMDEASRAKAREFATGYAREPVLGRLTFIELLSLLMMTIAASGGGYVLWGNFPAEIKGAVVTMMFLGGWNGVKEFWFGSSYGSRTKDAPPK